MIRPEYAICRVVRDGRAVGLAFAVGERALLTCAHVVNAWLGRRVRDATPPDHRDPVLVEFPFGGEPDDVPVRYATVAMWGPASGSFDRHDVAGLVLRDSLPSGVTPLRLTEAGGRGGAVVHLWGPGRAVGAEPRGAHVEAEFRGAVAPGLYQVDQRTAGLFKAAPGFSGGPVWQRDDGQVIGVLSAAALADDEADAYIIGADVAVAAWPDVLYRPPPCPYRGLDAFGPDDAALYFGREAVVATLVDLADRLPVVAVVGPSGTGKSSVIAAGLVATLRERAMVTYASARPGRGVMAAIARELAATASASSVIPPPELEAWERRLEDRGIGPALHTVRRAVGADRAVLVLDQFEQVMGSDHPDDQRQTCLRLLGDLVNTARDPEVLVVLALRHDFFGQLIALDPRFGPYLQTTATMLYPPAPDELRAAVVEPARRADPRRPVHVQPELVAQIVDDFSGQAGELPLVQFALTRLWQRMSGPVLTLNAYAELGGARRALTDFADACVDRLPEEQQAAARRVFCRLGLTDGFAVGRRVLRSELPDGDWEVAQRLAGPDARLLVVDWDSGADAQYVEVAHEVLLRAWPRLRQWLHQDREFLTWLRATTSAYETWQEHQQDVRLLLPEPLLDRAEEMLAERGAEATHLRGFVERSRRGVDHDDLTGLPNRRAVVRAIEDATRRRLPDQVVAVFEVDIARVGDINEAYGHAIGDELIAAVGVRLRELAPPAAAVGRLSGNAFGITLRLPHSDAAVRVAEELHQEVRGVFVLESVRLDVDVAIGIAVHPDHGADPETLLRRANTAVHTAKRKGAEVTLLPTENPARASRFRGLAGDLRDGLAGGIEVYYQPVFDLRTGRLARAEALARWHHPTYGFVSPAEFIPIVEESRLGYQLTEAVLSTALGHRAGWPSHTGALALSVNVSAGALTEAALPGLIERVTREHGLLPGDLTLEITESDLLSLARHLGPLHDLGARLSVDDFGTGYSNLAYLRRLPVDELKIAHTFIGSLGEDPNHQEIIRAIVRLASALGITVVAVGIETPGSVNRLLDMGCHLGQGFYLGPPMPFPELVTRYADGPPAA